MRFLSETGVTVAVLQEKFRSIVLAKLKAMSWSQSRLAREMGTAQPLVNKYLNGKHAPGLDTVERFARALECDPLELLGAQPHPGASGF